MELDIEELRNEAHALDLKFHPNLGAAKLKDLIDAHYAELEAAEPAQLPDVIDDEDEEEQEEQAPKKEEKSGKLSMKAWAAKNAREARKTRVVTVIDNDQRVNNQTTVCVVNCSNEYFDLGTAYIPLNEKVEVRQGHINVLANVTIPLHQRDPSNPQMSITVMRPRYTIQYHDNIVTE